MLTSSFDISGRYGARVCLTRLSKGCVILKYVFFFVQVRGEAQALRSEMETQRNHATQLEQLFQQQVSPALFTALM